MKYLQRQQFSFTKTSIEIKVSPENPESCKLQFFFFLSKQPCRIFILQACFPVFAIFRDELEARKSLKAFFLPAKL